MQFHSRCSIASSSSLLRSVSSDTLLVSSRILWLALSGFIVDHVLYKFQSTSCLQDGHTGQIKHHLDHVVPAILQFYISSNLAVNIKVFFSLAYKTNIFITKRSDGSIMLSMPCHLNHKTENFRLFRTFL